MYSLQFVCFILLNGRQKERDHRMRAMGQALKKVCKNFILSNDALY